MKKYSIGIDLGGTKILTALVDRSSGKVVHFVKKKIKQEKGAENIINKMICSINELFDECKVDIKEVQAIGVAAAGQIDRTHGIILGAPNLECFDLNIREILEGEFKLPVYLGIYRKRRHHRLIHLQQSIKDRPLLLGDGQRRQHLPPHERHLI